MQLSKQQFSSLSKAEKQRLMRVSSTAKKALPSAPQQRAGRRNGRRNGGRNGTNPSPIAFKQYAAASAYSTGLSTRAPIITMTRDQCRIRHRELISSVVGSAAFTVAESFSVNPGLAASFPWLSVMAQAWEQYEFNMLRFCYYTRTGTNVPGSLMMAFDYDAADDPPTSEQIASSYEGVVEDAPWKDICCDVRKVSMAGPLKKHYTRNGPLAANLDIKTYDVGRLHLITLDGTAVPWGKLWVEYDITFNLPQLPPTGVISAGLGGTINSGGSVSGGNPLGTTPTVDPQSKGISIDNASVLTLASTGDFVIVLHVVGTGLDTVTPTPGAGVTPIAFSQSANAAQTNVVCYLTVRVTNPPTATLAFTMIATTVTISDLNIGQSPDGSLN